MVNSAGVLLALSYLSTPIATRANVSNLGNPLFFTRSTSLALRDSHKTFPNIERVSHCVYSFEESTVEHLIIMDHA